MRDKAEITFSLCDSQNSFGAQFYKPLHDLSGTPQGSDFCSYAIVRDPTVTENFAIGG